MSGGWTPPRPTHRHHAIAAILYLAPDAATRTDLLAPIDDQQRRVSATRRNHAQVADVDPETGEELVDDEAYPSDVLEGDETDGMDTNVDAPSPQPEPAAP